MNKYYYGFVLNVFFISEFFAMNTPNNRTDYNRYAQLHRLREIANQNDQVRQQDLEEIRTNLFPDNNIFLTPQRRNINQFHELITPPQNNQNRNNQRRQNHARRVLGVNQSVLEEVQINLDNVYEL